MDQNLRPGTWPADIAPSRLAAAIRRSGLIRPGSVALIGLPDDAGIILNHGRPGAREGPTAFRAALARYGVAEPHAFAWPDIIDVGDVIPATGADAVALRETHRRATDVVRAALDCGALPVCIGGGHDLTYASARAVCERAPAAAVYFDAHLDVRAEPGSGMAFRSLVDSGGLREMHILGFDPFANAAEHVRWFAEHGGTIHGAELPRGSTLVSSLPIRADRLFASFDLDVLDGGIAPGVSAMNPSGWTAAQAGAWVEACGRDHRVALFDLMELSPPHDQDGRTARLAAHLFLRFLHGVSTRG